MSKVSFRARALDANKPMPVFNADELPDLSEYAACNRAVPQMPTGMEKEEEMELHLQQAISAQQATTSGTLASFVIPVPKVSLVQDYETQSRRQKINNYVPPKQLIKVQAALNLEPEIPDYDMDSEDERWLDWAQKNMDITELQFETLMDRFEKASEHHVLQLHDAKLAIAEDDDIIVAVYDYWLTKRRAHPHGLIHRIRTEKKDGSTGVNPYVAFRRRAERMQTRKNRKNDEDSYEKILKLGQDLRKAVTLLEMVKRREKTKRELIHLGMEIFDRRFQLSDWDDTVYQQILRMSKPSFQFNNREETLQAVKRKREHHKKRKHHSHRDSGSVGSEEQDLGSREWLKQKMLEFNRPLMVPGSPSRPTRQRRQELGDQDGKFAFKRSRGCVYLAPKPLDRRWESGDHSYGRNNGPRSSWPWEDSRTPQYLSAQPLFLHSSSGGLRFIGAARARRGRGGRLIFDRQSLPERICESAHRLDPSSSAHNHSLLMNCAFDSGECSATSVLDASRRSFYEADSITGVSEAPSQERITFYRPPSPDCVQSSDSNPELNALLYGPSSLSLSPPDRPSILLHSPDGQLQCHMVKLGVTSETLNEHWHRLQSQKGSIAPTQAEADSADVTETMSKETSVGRAAAVVSDDWVRSMQLEQERRSAGSINSGMIRKENSRNTIVGAVEKGSYSHLGSRTVVSGRSHGKNWLSFGKDNGTASVSSVLRPPLLKRPSIGVPGHNSGLDSRTTPSPTQLSYIRSASSSINSGARLLTHGSAGESKAPLSPIISASSHVAGDLHVGSVSLSSPNAHVTSNGEIDVKSSHPRPQIARPVR